MERSRVRDVVAAPTGIEPTIEERTVIREGRLNPRPSRESKTNLRPIWPGPRALLVRPAEPHGRSGLARLLAGSYLREILQLTVLVAGGERQGRPWMRRWRC